MTEAFRTEEPESRLATTGGGFCVLGRTSARRWTDWRARWSEDESLAFAWRLVETEIGPVLRINPECQNAMAWRTAVGHFVLFHAFGEIDVERAFERTRSEGAIIQRLTARGSRDLVILDEWFPYREGTSAEHAFLLRTRRDETAQARLMEVDQEGGYAICLALG